MARGNLHRFGFLASFDEFRAGGAGGAAGWRDVVTGTII